MRTKGDKNICYFCIISIPLGSANLLDIIHITRLMSFHASLIWHFSIQWINENTRYSHIPRLLLWYTVNMYTCVHTERHTRFPCTCWMLAPSLHPDAGEEASGVLTSEHCSPVQLMFSAKKPSPATEQCILCIFFSTAALWHLFYSLKYALSPKDST